MANQVAARLQGDDFQHLLAWFHALELRMERKRVATVRVEDPSAASADDVTIHRAADSLLPDEFHQIKFHVAQTSAYSTDLLIDRGDGATSLLEKLFRTWRTLRERDPHRDIEIHFISNWPWSANDAIGSYISGNNYALIDGFYDAGARSKVGKLRDAWRKHLGATPSEFSAFCRTLRLKVGFNAWADVVEWTAERMDSLGLKSDESTLILAVGIVREWVKTGGLDIDQDTLARLIDRHDLQLPATTERAVHVRLTTIKEQAFDIDPDFTVDWRDHFLGDSHKRGHQLRNPEDWNRMLLPELLDVEAQINQQPARLVRVRGKARLCAWFAFGRTFSAPNGYRIEIEQNGEPWRSDASASAGFALVSPGGDWVGETLRDATETVAVGISVTADISKDVRRDVTENRPDVSALLLLHPQCAPSPTCLTTQGDAAALALNVKSALREFCRERNAKRMRLYYCGPIAGACFIGHQLNALCPEIEIMEYDAAERAYHPSFRLA